MSIFSDLMIVLIFSVINTLLFSYLKIPPIIIFIFTGFLIGPSGLKIIKNSNEIEFISEIGIVLLLFTIGLEFSIKELREKKKDIFYLGFLQVFITIIVSSFFLFSFYSFIVAIFTGILISLSSTAIVLKVLQDQNQLHSISGKIQISISIFQDLISVIFMITLPYFREIQFLNSTSYLEILHLETILPLLLKILIFILGFYLLLKYIIPLSLNLIVKTRNKDLFALSVIVLCFLITYLTYKAGFSVALGAFLAGLLISETEYSYETLSNILPFKIVFTSIFFVSIGMLVDIDFILSNYHWLYILLASIGFGFLKFIVIFLIVYFFYKNIRVSFITGIFLSQMGEFSFILLNEAVKLEIINQEIYQILLSITIITMLFSILLIENSYKIYDIFENLFFYFFKDIPSLQRSNQESFTSLKDHIIIIGYGINGRNVAKAAKIVDIPYVIVEMNAKTVKEEKSKGEFILFGDATNVYILEKINIQLAKMIVIVINDPEATKKIIKLSKKLNPNIYVLARTRYIMEVPNLKELGANEVIPEEFETSIQIFRKILEHYQFSLPEIEFFAEELRISGYDFLRRIQS